MIKFTDLALPGLALGAAAVLLLPAEEAVGFSKIGGNLSTVQRDFRVFNNFADAASNNNVTPDPMFPGADGAELAIWKGYIEWSSLPHGDGTGDPRQTNLGDGGANFDPFWAGIATAGGNTDNNIVSAIGNCGGGTLAYTETPISNGWRIKFCDNWTWADGPGTIGFGSFDIQSTAAHEFGHALGLGHSGNSLATMRPAISAGQLGVRSIADDDIAGLQCIYGAMSSTKPVICQTEIIGGTLNIHGVNFDPVDNDVWFTNANVTPTAGDPKIKVLGLPSSNNGTLISLTIPAEAGPGDVAVKLPGGTTGNKLSNAFPTDLVSTITNGGLGCGAFGATAVAPNPVPALLPGTGQDVVVTGNQLNLVTSISLNLTPINSERWTIVNETTITIDLPQSPFLGTNALILDTGTSQSIFNFDIVEPTEPVLQVGNGEPLNLVTQATGLNVTVAGEVGEVHWLYYSPSNVPSTWPTACFDMGNNFTQFLLAKTYTIGASGYTEENIPFSYAGPVQPFYMQTIDVGSGASPKFGISNLQSITLSP